MGGRSRRALQAASFVLATLRMATRNRLEGVRAARAVSALLALQSAFKRHGEGVATEPCVPSG